MEKNETIVPELNNETIESMIYIIRGQKVMLDFELAKIYGYSTRDFNNQIKNNIERFDVDFRFQLTKIEWDDFLRCKISTANNLSKRRYLPYAFTEQGIYMLMTVLKGDLATRQSKALIRAFKQMKDYIVENKDILSTNETIKLTNLVNEHSNRIAVIENKLEIVMDNFIDPNTYKHYLIKDGEKIEADVAYQSIYRLAKYSIYIIDDYIDIKTLQLLKCIKENINVIIFTDNKGKNNLNINFINDFKNDTNINITLKKNNNRFHDRYVIIDFNTDNYMIYHCGASSKDSGNKINTITNVLEKEVYIDLINEILNNDELIID
ncbi:MAG: ORF6N domain-containing protein [Acholeplasmatales bacterium]|nr:ORF6N domain-containing protein [Acholeplasmatales bacterium]